MNRVMNRCVAKYSKNCNRTRCYYARIVGKLGTSGTMVLIVCLELVNFQWYDGTRTISIFPKRLSYFGHLMGWQWTFEPEQETCELCNGELGHSKVHPGKRGRSVLITNMHPFKTVEIYVKTCSNCSAMHQVFPYEFGK